MKIFVSKYSLLPLENSKRKPREGALLKVVLPDDDSVGYCDCHPWKEFGDFSLVKELELLAKGTTTQLTKRSLEFAYIDAQARLSKRSLFHEMKFPKNHQHVSDSGILNEVLLEKFNSEAVKLIKVKVGFDVNAACKFLRRFAPLCRYWGLQFRLDFNGKLDKKEFLTFVKACSHELDIIDFFEDPFPYDSQSWQEIRKHDGVRLACDKDSLGALAYPDSCDYLVIKPAIQGITPFLSPQLQGRKLVLTSYLDHPIGQTSALYTACKLLKDDPEKLSECGFLTHHAYVPNDFSRLFSEDKGKLIPSLTGHGWGYDELLEQLEWVKLI